VYHDAPQANLLCKQAFVILACQNDIVRANILQVKMTNAAETASKRPFFAVF